MDVKTGREANGTIEVYGNLKEGNLVLKTATDEIRNGTTLQNLKTIALSTGCKFTLSFYLT